MKIESKDHLIKMFDVQYNAQPDKDIDFYKMFMAVEILRIMIDNEWVNQSIFNCHNKLDKTNREAYKFFRSGDLGYNWQERVYRLAEWVFNLRDVANFDLIIKDILNGELVSRYAEMEVGSHLKINSINFEFVKPSGQKGNDFDIKIKDKIDINCEVKHKIEDTDFSEKTIEKSLSKANKQIPQDSPAIIFIKYPSEWTEDPNYMEKIQSASKSFLNRNKAHIVALIFCFQIPFRGGMSGWAYNVLRNPNYVHNQPTINVLNKLETMQLNSEWVIIENLIREQLKIKRKSNS